MGLYDSAIVVVAVAVVGMVLLASQLGELTTEARAATEDNAPPLTFEGEHYDALDAALKNRMRAQAPR